MSDLCVPVDGDYQILATSPIFLYFGIPEAGLSSIIAYPFVDYIYILPIAIEAITPSVD